MINHKASSLFNEFQVANFRPLTSTMKDSNLWINPKPPWYKINIDRAVFAQQQATGVGVLYIYIYIYCVQRGCGTKIKCLQTFSVVFIHKMALKNSVRREVDDCVFSEFTDFMFFRERLNGV